MAKRSSPPAVGASSLLVIFAVLCLTVFALLSLSTVQADKRLADASTEAAMAYYTADLEAERIFALLRAGEVPENVTIQSYSVPVEGDAVSGRLCTYACTISETQKLAVELVEQNGMWTVLRWQMVSTEEWDNDDSISIWDGEGIF